MNHRNSSLILNLSLLSCILTIGLLSSCTTASGSDKNQIPKSVLAFLDDNDWSFSDFESSDMSNRKAYHRHIRYYTADEKMEEVWEKYLDADPRELWNGPMAQYGIMYSPGNQQSYESDYPSRLMFAEGQIYILDLLIGYWLHIPVAFQITKIDKQNHVLEFTYLKQNKSNGQQEMSFSSYVGRDGKDHTLIKHLSYYTSHAKFRDKALYPDFHNETIDEYHRCVAQTSNLGIKPIPESRIRILKIPPEAQK